ncbi:MAG: hypothetical protein ISS45_04835 [Candidatus Omnitrophica bacterium]|nr:hypothetical protein [Candidatus Omnitrophota bacterium]
MRIKRILCQSKQKFKELKKELKRFYKEKFKKAKFQKPAKKKKEILDLTSKGILTSKIVQEYRPSNIINAYNSDLWRWRRVNEWFTELSQRDQPSLNNDSIKDLAAILKK